jgi:hypothetical protein
LISARSDISNWLPSPSAKWRVRPHLQDLLRPQVRPRSLQEPFLFGRF